MRHKRYVNKGGARLGPLVLRFERLEQRGTAGRKVLLTFFSSSSPSSRTVQLSLLP